MHQSNWFEDRGRILILSACEALNELDKGTSSSDVTLQLKQNLVEGIRLYRLASKTSHPPTMQAWMCGDTERELRQAVKDAEALFQNPSSVVAWLELFARRLGEVPPEEWKDRGTGKSA